MRSIPEQEVLMEIFTASEELLRHDTDLFERLSSAINHLIVNDFERLVSILYRLDISEARLTALLAQKRDEHAADTIALLILERQLEKIKSRWENRRDNNNIDEDEKW